MNDANFVCARSGCDVLSPRKTHNQIYCSDECCRLATNLRIMEKYYEKKEQRSGAVRICKRCKKTKLSRYNDTNVCSPCSLAHEDQINDSVLQMLQRTNLSL